MDGCFLACCFRLNFLLGVYMRVVMGAASKDKERKKGGMEIDKHRYGPYLRSPSAASTVRYGTLAMLRMLLQYLPYLCTITRYLRSHCSLIAR